MTGPLAARLWRYQAERFPLARNAAVIAAFGASTIAFSHLARGAAGIPSLATFAAGIASSLLMLALLRIADEHKDAAEDATFRPYRPVPRGLVTLGELRAAGAACATAQVAIALAISPRLLLGLALVWAWFGLMSVEFFVPRFLRAHPVAYLASHMAIMPLLDGYVSSFDWISAHARPPAMLGWFLAISFANGLVVEIGRKMRRARDEERGVETYTALWGRRGASAVFVGILATAATIGCATAGAARFPLASTLAIGFAALAATGVAVAFLRDRLSGSAVEAAAGGWTFASYCALGLLPLGVTLR